MQATIRYADKADAETLHLFLLLVSPPSAVGRIDAVKSLAEVYRVIEEDVAILAEINGELVATLGIIRVPWWYGPDEFLTDRWFFLYPQLKNQGVGAALLGEAHGIGRQAGLPVVIHGHMRQKRDGLFFVKPVIMPPNEEVDYRQKERALAL